MSDRTNGFEEMLDDIKRENRRLVRELASQARASLPATRLEGFVQQMQRIIYRDHERKIFWLIQKHLSGTPEDPDATGAEAAAFTKPIV